MSALDAPAGGAIHEPRAVRHGSAVDEGLHRSGERLKVCGSMSQNTGRAPTLRNRPRGREKGERRGDDLVAGADLERHQREQQRIGAGRHADAAEAWQ